MGFKKGLIYYFDDASSTGVDKVPTNKFMINMETGEQFLKTTNVGITDTSTLQSVIDDGIIVSTGGSGVVGYIETPSITSPVNGAIDTEVGINIIGSTYTTTATFAGPFSSIEVEIATDSEFTNVVFSGSNSVTNISANTLSASTNYFARIRYVSGDFRSDWSTSVSFTTMNAGISAPSITGPTNNATEIGKKVTVSLNTYSAFGHSETHVSTDWQVASDIGFTSIISESISDGVNLTTWTSSDLSVSTTYYIRARYKSVSYTSAYSSVITFTTSDAFNVPIGIPGTLGFGVGVALDVPANLTGMSGFEDPANDNFGNYQTSNGSVFVFIPKFYYKWTGNALSILEDDNGGDHVLHRAFINAGQEKDGFFISKYSCGIENNTAVSKPGLDPLSFNSAHNSVAQLTSCSEEINASAILAAKDFGASYHCSSIFQHNAIALIAYAQGKAGTNCAYADVAPYLPKGNNTSLTDVDDGTVTFTGSGYADCALTGSGSNFAKTTHNGQNCGVADVNGNMYQVAIGLTRAGTSATDTTDKDTINDFFILDESYDIANLEMQWTSGDSLTNNAFGDSTYLNGVNSPYKKFTSTKTTFGATYMGSGPNQVFPMSTDRNSNDYLSSSCFIPNDNGSDGTGTTEFGNDYFYQDDQPNLLPLVRGYYSYSSYAGVFHVYLTYSRSNSYDNASFSASSY